MGRVLTFLSILALAACGAAPGTPTAQDKSDTKAAGEKSAFNADDVLPWDPAVRKGVLPNGLSYFIERNDHPKGRAELRLVVKVGSVVEDEDQLGLAHFVEHMAFNGSTNFSGNQLIDTMERFGMGFGAHLNAYTSFDETVYKLQIPTEPKLLDTGLLVLRDWAGGLTFDPKEVAKERGVVLDEWRRTRGARGRIRDALIPLQFKGSQYAKRLPIGTEKSLKTFTREQAVRFYRDWYRPDLMAVIVVGEFDVDKMEAQIKARFGDLKNPEKSRERIQFKIPAQDENLYGIITDPEISSSGVSMTQIVKERKSRTVGEYKSTLVRSMALSMLNGRFRETARRKDRPFRGAYAYQSAMNPSYARQGIGATPYEGRTRNSVSRHRNSVGENDRSFPISIASSRNVGPRNRSPLPASLFDISPPVKPCRASGASAIWFAIWSRSLPWVTSMHIWPPSWGRRVVC